MTSENNKDLINTVSRTFNSESNNSEKNSITNNNSTQDGEERENDIKNSLMDSKESQSPEAEKLLISNNTSNSKISKNAEENGIADNMIKYTQNSNGNRKNKNKKGKHSKKNAFAFESEIGNQEENKVSDSQNNFESKSKNENDLIDNLNVDSYKKEKETTKADSASNINNSNSDAMNSNSKINSNEDNSKLENDETKANDSIQRKNGEKSNNKIKDEENHVRENLIIINDKAVSENSSPQIRKIEEDISNKSMEKRNSQSSSNSTCSKNEKTNLNDSTGGLKADKTKENLDEGKSNFSKIRHREDSILTEIQENLNENYSSLTKFFVKESLKNVLNAEDSHTEAHKAENAPENKGNFAASNGAGEIESIPTRKMQLKLFLDKALEYKLLANDYFKKNKFNDAIREYINALELLKTENTELSKIENILNMSNLNMIKLECLNNIAVCSYIMKDYNNVLEKTSEVLSYNPNNFNALCYRAKALIALNNAEEALKYIKQALSIKYNKTLFKYLTDLETKQRKLSDEMLFNKLQEQHLKNLESNIFNSNSPKICQNNLERLKSNDSKISSKDSSDSKEKKQVKESIFKEASIKMIKNNNMNNNNITINEAIENNPTIEVNNNDTYNNNNYNRLNEKEKLNFVKILNETSLNTNLISDNAFYANNNNTINDSVIQSNNYKNTCDNKASFYSSSRIIKIIKIMLMYFVQYLRKHKAIVCLLTLIFLFMKRKSIVVLLKRILGN